MLYLIAFGSQLTKWHDQITRLNNQVFGRTDSYRDLCGCFADPQWILATDRGQLLGMMALGPTATGFHVYNVAVDPLYRRTHIATQMAQHLLSLGTHFSGRVAQDNQRAHALYRQLGAQVTETKEGFVYYTLTVTN